MAYLTVGTSGINFNLKPATSDTVELGLKSQNTLGLFTFAVFHTETKNDIVPDDANGGRSTFRNAEKTLREGLELSWQKQLWQALNIRTSYSYLDATFDADIPATTTKPLIQKGTYIPGIAKNQAFVGLAWQLEQGFQAGLEARYMDKIYVDDINSDTAPSYTVVAANVGYLWVNKDWKVNTYARLDNLLDRNYVGSVIVNDSNNRFFEPADRRNFNVGLSIKKYSNIGFVA